MEGNSSNRTSYLDITSNGLADSNNSNVNIWQPRQNEELEMYRNIKFICYRIILPCILGIGVIGNVLNIIILRKQRLRRSMDKMESCANMGLVFLALSDLLFCLVGLPSAFLNTRHFADQSRPLDVVELYYTLYKPGVLNIFLLSSTWCVVLIAMERYLVVTHPMKARSSVRLCRTVILQVVIIVASVIVNIPHFLTYNIQHMKTERNTTLILPSISNLAYLTTFRNIYIIIWNIFGTVIPVIVLFFCNINLLIAICKTKSISVANSNGCQNKYRYSTSRVTFILVAIIFLFFFLVCPSSVLSFIQEVYISQSRDRKSYKYLSALVMANVLQSSNFAINFMLYFGMNPKFRSNMRTQCTNATCISGKKMELRIKQYELVHV